MKSLITRSTIAAFVAISLTLSWLERPLARSEASIDYVPGELFIKFVEGASHPGITQAIQSIGAQHIKTFGQIDVSHWRLGGGMSVEQAIQVLSNGPFKDYIEYVEPNYLAYIGATPDDPSYNQLWGLNNVGQTGGTFDADIDAAEAWDIETGSSTVVVADIDTGIDPNHEDLVGQVWVNPGEIAGNGIDDDGNGYIDDVSGWDFVSGDNDPFDDNSHGTHTAGTIGAIGNNGIGVTGVCWSVTIMPLKCFDAGGRGTADRVIEAVLYAASFEDGSGNKIVRITNNSYTLSFSGRNKKKSKTLEAAIASSGALYICSAGNNGGSSIRYPAGFSLDNIISVAATDHNDALASFSNYGSDWVDLGAPGVDVLSTEPANFYDTKSGTSMSAPHVVGTAALVLAHDALLTNAQIKAAILDNVDVISSLQGITVTGGRLNAAGALGGSTEPPTDVTPPAAVTDLTAPAVTSSTIDLAWTATGDDGSAGTATAYDVRYLADTPIDDANWSTANQASGEPTPRASGGAESFTVSGLQGNTNYYLAMKVIDEVGNVSDLSNVVLTTTDESAGGAWITEVLAPGASYHDLAVDPAGNPSVAYTIRTGGKHDDVRLATWNGSTWDDEIAGGANNVVGVALAYSPVTNQPNVCFNPGLTFASKNGSTWESDKVVRRGARGEASLAFDQDGNPSIAYIEDDDLSLARWNGSSWDLEVVTTHLGIRYFSHAYDPAGNPAIAYEVRQDPDVGLHFARWNGSSWTTEFVDAGGADAHLVYDPSTGFPTVAHTQSSTLKFAKWNGTSWDKQSIQSGGRRTSLAYNPVTGFPSILHRGGDDNLTYLAWNGVSWDSEIIFAGIGSGDALSHQHDAAGNPLVSFQTASGVHFAQKSSAPLASKRANTERIFADKDMSAQSLVTLGQNYPNPFNPSTEISFSLAEASNVRLEVFNIMGRRVSTVSDRLFEAGNHTVIWDGHKYPSGLYFYRINAGAHVETRKMLLLK